MTTSLTITFSSGNVTFSGAEILSASLVEQINPLSVEAPTNVIKFTVYSATANFSIINPQGFYANLQYLEPFEVTETINGTPVYLGRFYLETWNSESENRATFTAFDELGVLNDVPLDKDFTVWGQEILDGTISVGTLMGYLFDSLFDSSLDYEIAIELYDVPVYGWLKSKQTYRELLCQLAFIGGAYVTCSRSNKVLVKMLELLNYNISFDGVQIDDEDALITWTGYWFTNSGEPNFYLGTYHAMDSSTVYPNIYFSFEFDGVGFEIGYGFTDLDLGKFYVSIDGEALIEVIETLTGGGSIIHKIWTSSLLSDGHHSVIVYGWVSGTETFSRSSIWFDYISYSSLGLPDTTYNYIITKAEQATDFPVTQRPQVTGVEITSHNYIWDGGSNIVIYKGTLGAGTYTIEFEEPHGYYTISGATIDLSGIDWITFTVTTSGEIEITGRKNIDSRTVFGFYNNDLPIGARENIIKITDVPFAHPQNAQAIAMRIYNYYQQRLLQNSTLFSSLVNVGDTILIDTQASRKISGIVERMETDLVGGFISKIEVIGILYPCSNVLTANLVINSGETINYVDCLNTFGYTITINSGGILNIT